MPKISIVHMTAEDWYKIHKDYKTTIQGKPFVMVLDRKTQATTLTQVKLQPERRN